jgi:hypothetical protein
MRKVAVALVCVVLLALVTVVYVVQKRANGISSKAAKFDEFCWATRDAARQDRVAFERGDERHREEAYERFYEGSTIFHNSVSFLMCVEEIPELPIGCWLNKDWNCLARIAGEIEVKIPRY